MLDGKMLLTISQVAQELGLGKSTVYLLAQQGKLPVVRFGSAVRINADRLREWIEQKTQSPSER
ncbi:MAG: helix-turn-helix domain-containing protein [Chloroflexi bacterium]|nr:helix-turn-helix domain-containing protein [Chloroflexota bacterium]